MILPIEQIPNVIPPRFRWKQVVSTPIGTRTIEHEAELPPSLEGAVIQLIGLLRLQDHEIGQLKKTNQEFADRIAGQSELLSKHAEATKPQITVTKGRKG